MVCVGVASAPCAKCGVQFGCAVFVIAPVLLQHWQGRGAAAGATRWQVLLPSARRSSVLCQVCDSGAWRRVIPAQAEATRCSCAPQAVPVLLLLLLAVAGCSEAQLHVACSVPRDSLMSFGVCFGKFTKSRKFILKITCLDYLAEHAKVLWRPRRVVSPPPPLPVSPPRRPFAGFAPIFALLCA